MYYFFFFQAGDGIRDSPWSRGLGDVYKGQLQPEVDVKPSRASGARSNVYEIAVAASSLARAAIRHQQSAAAAAQAFAGHAVRERRAAASTARPASSHVLGDDAERREGNRA